MAEGRESSPEAAAPISVVQVNTHDDAGGAARVARDLHEGLLRVGERSRMAVGRKRLSDRFRATHRQRQAPQRLVSIVACRRIGISTGPGLVQGEGPSYPFAGGRGPTWPSSCSAAWCGLFRVSGNAACRRLGGSGRAASPPQPSWRVLRPAGAAGADGAVPHGTYTARRVAAGGPLRTLFRVREMAHRLRELSRSVHSPSDSTRRNRAELARETRRIRRQHSLCRSAVKVAHGQGGDVYSRSGNRRRRE